MKRICSICHDPKMETRPYGVGGAEICHGCMKSDPEREAEAKRQFGIRLKGTATLLTDAGPVPLVTKGKKS